MMRKDRGAYQAFGLTIRSEIPLPELRSAEKKGVPDVTIRYGDLSREWADHSIPGSHFAGSSHFMIFRIKNAGIFRVEDGKTVIVSPFADADHGAIRLYLLGSCLGAILLQRRTLPLHGCTVAIDGRAYAFVGEMGAGKSTLAAEWIRLGHPLISDDVTAVSFLDNGTPVVTPSYPQQKLWQSTLQMFGERCSVYQPIYLRETKYYVPVLDGFQDRVLPLAGIFELDKTEKPEADLLAVRKLDQFRLLLHHTYRNFFIPSMGLAPWQFKQCARLAKSLTLYRLVRPAEGGFTAPKLASLVIEHIRSAEAAASDKTNNVFTI
ncbi:aldolase [Sporolactobacillus sp. THM7-4]|nr:aldolase [Sporolactobacillus sp. THM7-4]